ncbi:uncharacterized protein [Penaeus vannamei]|uniref:uncharacterized protein n=1 Tax=Penaeus vannamei TaxID=6689 RepID=UPI00387F9437
MSHHVRHVNGGRGRSPELPYSPCRTSRSPSSECLTPSARGNKYVLVLIDHLTRFVELFPLASKDAQTVADVFLAEFITRYGPPRTLLSEFRNRLLSDICHHLHAAWNKMQALATLPDLDPTTNKPRRVDLMRELWLQCLPPSVRSALHEADDSPINDLIKKADNLINAARASRKPDTTYSVSAEDVPDINAANKRRPNSQVRHYKPGSASSQPSHGFCYYHYRFGAGAY